LFLSVNGVHGFHLHNSYYAPLVNCFAKKLSSEKLEKKALVPLIVEKAWDGGFSISDFWKDEYQGIRHYPMEEILKMCEFLVARGLLKQKDDGVYTPAI
jgi:hypothetical protein